MERTYISGIVHLVEHEEVELIASVEAGKLPISVAVEIAHGKDREIAEALSEAYESGQLRGNKLAAARRLIAKRIEKRQKEGKATGVQRKVTGNMFGTSVQTACRRAAGIDRQGGVRQRAIVIDHIRDATVGAR